MVVFYFCATAHSALGNSTVDDEYQNILTEYTLLMKEIPVSLRRRYELKSTTTGSKPLKKHQIEQKKHYISVKSRFEELTHIRGLRGALLSLFDEITPEIKIESDSLATAIIPEIVRLKKNYDYVGSPIVHNMMINMKARDRGACKHWAEDLLAFITKQKHNHFIIAWGEANPEKISEHNVAVLYPVGKTFHDGLLIDPWRTKGNPFWIKIKEDKHYSWHQWHEYGVH